MDLCVLHIYIHYVHLCPHFNLYIYKPDIIYLFVKHTYIQYIQYFTQVEIPPFV